MKKLICLFLSIAMLNIVVAQNKNAWTAYTGPEKMATDKSVARKTFPTQFKLYELNAAELSQQLFSEVRDANSRTIIELPNADGQMEAFEIFEASNFEPALQARFPEIRAFSGKGLTDKYATLKLSYSPQGIQTTVFRTDKPMEFMEPYSADHKVYAVFRSYRPAGELNWRCSTPDEKLTTELNAQVMHLTARSGGDLKTMRLAQSCNAEYSNYFGATSATQVNLVLAAFNATLTRCNGVYEKDLALHLNLIANTTSVIYYSAGTDPYTTMSSWNSQLQSTLNSVIGAANYDIGHMFGASGGGGNAGCIGCVCNDANKGSGITSPADGIPAGDNFDIDYVAHEIGHQLGGNHTFSMSNEGTGVNKEPGSGITIMGYAGITSQDVANHSIDIFHQATINQIQTNLGTKTCPITTSISANNATPVVATVGNFTIPKSTPFALTGSATDANGDALTYCWEQNDNAGSTQTGASSVASATKATGPNWVTFPATASPTRLFPRLSSILTGAVITGPLTGGDAGANTEALSSVARTLNFRLTVRDNCPYSSTAPVKVGQTQFKDVVVTVNGVAGPFAVTAPNTAVTYAGGSTQTITWSVNSTNLAPINCSKVKISLSTDGGQTFPYVLADSTANDGTEALAIPAVPSTTARIKIEAVGNIFFDICNTNFTIGAAVACGDASGLTSSAIGNNTATISWTAVSGAISYAVDYKLNTSATWTSFAAAQAGTTANLTGLTQGSLYDWRVRATCNAGSGNYVQAQFTTTAPFVCNAPTGLASSAITTSSATVSWTAVTGATNYAVSYKRSVDTTWTVAAAATATTSVSLTGLSASTIYNFRVSTNCGVNGTSGFTASQFTTAAIVVCNAPTGLASSAITSSSATVSWAAVTGASSYAVDYKLSTATTWTSRVTATTSISASITGLNPSSLYDYRVRTNCVGGTSAYTQGQFTTLVNTGCSSTYDNGTNNTANNTTTGALTIPFNTNITGLIGSGGDVDHYKFTFTRGGTITMTLTTLPANYNLRLVNSAGTILATSNRNGTNSETINYTVAVGTYYARVYGNNTSTFNATSCYTLRVALGTAARDGENTIAATPSIDVFPNPAQNMLNIKLLGFDGTAEIGVYNINGTKMLAKKSTTGNTWIDISSLPAGVYMLKANNGKAVVARNKFVKY